MDNILDYTDSLNNKQGAVATGRDNILDDESARVDSQLGEITYENAMRGADFIASTVESIDRYEAAISGYDAENVTVESAKGAVSAFSVLLDDLKVDDVRLASFKLDSVTHENATEKPNESAKLSIENGKKVIAKFVEAIKNAVASMIKMIKGAGTKIFTAATNTKGRAESLEKHINEKLSDTLVDDAKTDKAVFATLLPIIGKVSADEINAVVMAAGGTETADVLSKAVKDAFASKSMDKVLKVSGGYKGAQDLFDGSALVVSSSGKKVSALIAKDGKVVRETKEVTKVDGFKETDILKKSELVDICSTVKASAESRKESVNDILSAIDTIDDAIKGAKEEDVEFIKSLNNSIAAITSGFYALAFDAGRVNSAALGIVAKQGKLYKAK